MKKRKTSRRRASPGIANRRLLTSTLPTRSSAQVMGQDRRNTNRAWWLHPTTQSTREARIVLSNRNRRPGRKATAASLVFNRPEYVDICKRRRTRKAVIHARGVAGTKVKKPRRNNFSSIKCRS